MNSFGYTLCSLRSHVILNFQVSKAEYMLRWISKAESSLVYILDQIHDISTLWQISCSGGQFVISSDQCANNHNLWLLTMTTFNQIIAVRETPLPTNHCDTKKHYIWLIDFSLLNSCTAMKGLVVVFAPLRQQIPSPSLSCNLMTV